MVQKVEGFSRKTPKRRFSDQNSPQKNWMRSSRGSRGEGNFSKQIFVNKFFLIFRTLCVPKDDSSDDADVEDELSESDLTMAIKQRPKLVRKSPEKVQSNSTGTNNVKSDQSDHSKSKTKSSSVISRNNHATSKSSPPSKKKSGKNSGSVNSRFKRAAANKASDRINRESRGRLSLSSSSSDDSRISDLGGAEDLIKESRNLSSDDSDFDPKQSNESQ